MNFIWDVLLSEMTLLLTIKKEKKMVTLGMTFVMSTSYCKWKYIRTYVFGSKDIKFAAVADPGSSNGDAQIAFSISWTSCG